MSISSLCGHSLHSPRDPCGPGIFLILVTSMTRVSFFIDGFNLYHALARFGAPANSRWLDLRKLCECYITKQQVVGHIYYFTALAIWNVDKVRRHQIYLSVLESTGIDIILGEFRPVTKICRICHQQYSTYEEKKTDVNIALALFREGALGTYDSAMIMSGDSDLVPAVVEARRFFPTKKFVVVVPIGGRANQLSKECDCRIKMRVHHIQSSLFPEIVRTPTGRLIRCPTEWFATENESQK